MVAPIMRFSNDGMGCVIMFILFAAGVSGIVYSIVLIAGFVPYDHPKEAAPFTFIFGLSCLFLLYRGLRNE